MRQTRPICLASASPRRRELLARFGLQFEVCALPVDERLRPDEGPEQYVERMAFEKVEQVRRRFPDHLILAGDTTVVKEGAVMGKPEDEEQAAAMLESLSGGSHRVLSAYRLLDNATGEECRETVETQVAFRDLPHQWIVWYAALPEALDKAGAYAIQGVGAAMVAGINGSYTNVVGLPIESVIWKMVEKGWITL